MHIHPTSGSRKECAAEDDGQVYVSSTAPHGCWRTHVLFGLCLLASNATIHAYPLLSIVISIILQSRLPAAHIISTDNPSSTTTTTRSTTTTITPPTSFTLVSPFLPTSSPAYTLLLIFHTYNSVILLSLFSLHHFQENPWRTLVQTDRRFHASLKKTDFSSKLNTGPAAFALCS